MANASPRYSSDRNRRTAPPPHWRSRLSATISRNLPLPLRFPPSESYNRGPFYLAAPGGPGLRSHERASFVSAKPRTALRALPAIGTHPAPPGPGSGEVVQG